MGDSQSLPQQQRLDRPGAKVTILTPTYNKPKHLLDCAESVFSQSFSDWDWRIVMDGPTDETIRAVGDILGDPRSKDDSVLPRVWFVPLEVSEDHRFDSHRPAAIVNAMYPVIETPYLYFLADDDLLHPDGLGTLCQTLDTNPDWDIVYGNCEVYNEQPDGSYQHMVDCFAGSDVGLGTGILPDCLLDGGQILQTKRSWTLLGDWRLPTDMAGAAHNDGIYLNRLAEQFTFHYVDTPLLVHRRTKLSTYHRQGL